MAVCLPHLLQLRCGPMPEKDPCQLSPRMCVSLPPVCVFLPVTAFRKSTLMGRSDDGRNMEVRINRKVVYSGSLNGAKDYIVKHRLGEKKAS